MQVIGERNGAGLDEVGSDVCDGSDQIAALGFNAVLEPRTEQVRQWWIDLSVARDFRWQDVLGEIALTVQDVACR